MDINEAREQISLIDTQMAGLFARRMELSREIAGYKREHGLPIEDREQEAQVIAAHAGLIRDEALRPYYIRFLQETIDLSKRWQRGLTGDEQVDPEARSDRQ
ncbi:MAG: chorismate mutase [Clostridia bacterium]|nr:chorismate mutase [Clostridia bacterium]